MASSPLTGPWAGFLWQVNWPRAPHAVPGLSGLTGLRNLPSAHCPLPPAPSQPPQDQPPSRAGAHCNKKPFRVPPPWLPHPCAGGPCPGILQAKPGDFKSPKSNSVPQLRRPQPVFGLAQAGTGRQPHLCLWVPGSPQRWGEGAPLHE